MKIGLIFAAGALAVTGVALTPAPAEARTYVSIGLGTPGYYGGYYGRQYYQPYYGGYYGQPYYGDYYDYYSAPRVRYVRPRYYRERNYYDRDYAYRGYNDRDRYHHRRR